MIKRNKNDSGYGVSMAMKKVWKERKSGVRQYQSRVIKDLQDILEIHHCTEKQWSKIWMNTKTDKMPKFVLIDPVQVAKYLYGCGYRKQYRNMQK